MLPRRNALHSILAAFAPRIVRPAGYLHVLTIRWKAEATADQRRAVLVGADGLTGQVPGLRSVWTKAVAVQGRALSGYSDAIAMEFVDIAAFAKMEEHPAYTAWEKDFFAAQAEHGTVNLAR